MPREGMLVRLDSSHHRWLQNRGLQFTLLLAVDDATGCVASALFCRQETTHDYFMLLEDQVRHWGLTLSLYTGGHTVFSLGRASRLVCRWLIPIFGVQFIVSLRHSMRAYTTKGTQKAHPI